MEQSPILKVLYLFVNLLSFQSMDIDEAFHAVGQYGRLQRQVFWSTSLPQAFVAWQHILNVFVGAKPRFHCIRADKSAPLDGCPSDDQPQCLAYEFAGDDFTSIVSEVWIVMLLLTQEFCVDYLSSQLDVSITFS